MSVLPICQGPQVFSEKILYCFQRPQHTVVTQNFRKRLFSTYANNRTGKTFSIEGLDGAVSERMGNGGPRPDLSNCVVILFYWTSAKNIIQNASLTRDNVLNMLMCESVDHLSTSSDTEVLNF